MNQMIQAGSAPGNASMPSMMAYEDWVEKFKPIQNSIDPNAAYDGCMFETYGKEMEAVKAANPLYVWTLVDGDEGKSILSSGYHYVNRIGYFITEIPFEPRPGMEFLDVLVDDGENPDFPLSDWQQEVAAGDTLLGYHEWVEHKYESEALASSSVKDRIPHIKVEYDPAYTGGEYSGVGRHVLIPVSAIEDAAKEFASRNDGAGMDEAVHLAFRKQTHMDSMHIVYYNQDELFDQVGEPIGGEA